MGSRVGAAGRCGAQAWRASPPAAPPAVTATAAPTELGATAVYRAGDDGFYEYVREWRSSRLRGRPFASALTVELWLGYHESWQRQLRRRFVHTDRVVDLGAQRAEPAAVRRAYAAAVLMQQTTNATAPRDTTAGECTAGGADVGGGYGGGPMWWARGASALVRAAEAAADAAAAGGASGQPPAGARRVRRLRLRSLGIAPERSACHATR